MTDQRILNALHQKHLSGGLSRRGFIKASAATGIGLTAAMSLASPVRAQTPVRGGSLRAGLASGATTDTLDPGLFEAGFLIPLGSAINGYLTEIDANSATQPSLAESWDASPDAKRWSFRLRDGVTFHNGRAVTPQDVIASINHHRGEA